MASCLFHVTTKSVLFGYWFLSSLAIWQYASVALAADAFPPQAEPLFRDPQLVIDADGVPGETIVDLDISPDGERLAVSSGKQVRIYSLESGRLWKTLHGYREGDGISIGMIQKAKFSPSGRFLVVGITDNTELGSTRVYDLTRPEQLHRLVKGHTGCTKGVAFSPTGNLLATWSCDGTILLLDWDENQGDGVELARFSKSDPNGTTSRLPFPYFGFPLNDDWLVFSEFNPQLIVFDTRRRRLLKSNFEWPPELRQFLLSPNREWLNWRDSCVGDFRLDNPQFRVGNPQGIVMSGQSSSSDGPARYWVDAWDSIARPEKRTHHGHSYFVTACCVKPQLNLCASADSLGKVRVWPLRSPSDVKHAFAPANRPIYRVAWSSDGNSLLFADKPHPQHLYWHNQFGTINYRFDLQRRVLSSGTPTDSNGASQHAHVPLPQAGIGEACVKLACKSNQLTADLLNYQMQVVRHELLGNDTVTRRWLLTINAKDNIANW